MYKEFILDLNRHPLNKKVLAVFDVEHREFNPTCGDDITIRIKFAPDGTVQDIGHHGQGCAISQAVASLVTDEVKGKLPKEIMSSSLTEINHLLGFEVLYTRRKCAELGLRAIQKALEHR